MLRRVLAELWRDRRGNMLLIFAFSVVPLTFATGMGIDYASAMRLQTRINAVADAASLAAVTAPMMKQTMDQACTAARATFVSQATNIPGLQLDTSSAAAVTISIVDTPPQGPAVTIACPLAGVARGVPASLPLSRTAMVAYSARSANSFGGILGKATLAIGGSATAKTIVAPFIDIHLALDTSQSMGLAATDEAARKLWYWTGKINGRSCQFGCHARDPHEAAANEDIAIAHDIPLRVNILRDATIDMIDAAVAGQGTAQTYQFALYRIGKDNGRYATGVDLYAPLTPDLASVRSKVASLRLSANDGAVGFGDTDLPSTTAFVLPSIKATSAAYDDGTTQAKARKFFFLVTDGVTDVEGPCIYGHCTRPLDPATCDAYKSKGITVGVVYTTYLPTKADPTDPANPNLRDEYIKLVEPIAPRIKPNLQACASPGWFFEGSDTPTIHAAMQALFRQATQTPTIIR